MKLNRKAMRRVLKIARSLTGKERDRIEKIRDRNEEREKLDNWILTLGPLVSPSQFQNLDGAGVMDILKKCRGYLKLLLERNLENCPPLILTGGVGGGKTTLAWAILFGLLEAHCRGGDPGWYRSKKLAFFKSVELEQILKDVAWRRDTLLCRRLPGKRLTGVESMPGEASTEREAIKYLNEVDLLILDDLVRHRLSEQYRHQLFAIVDGRYAYGKPTIVTNNVGLGKAAELELLDLRVASRLREDAITVRVNVKDRRLRPGRVKGKPPGWDLGYGERCTLASIRSGSGICCWRPGAGLLEQGPVDTRASVSWHMSS